jgi:hypothetical protein
LAPKNLFILPLLLLCIVLAAYTQESPPTQTTHVPGIPQYKVTLIRDVVYGRDDDFSLLLDIYMPDPSIATPTPVVIYIHGGGWGGRLQIPQSGGNTSGSRFFLRQY